MCLDPFSRKPNSIYPKVDVYLEKENYVCNHLLFIDDLKLLSDKEETLKSLVEESNTFFKTIGLEINKDKSATNSEICSETALVLDANSGYKYLGIIENPDGSVNKETFLKLKKEILSRVEKILKTNLNGKNSIRALNEYALSVVNYYIGVIPANPGEFEEQDDQIRQLLIFHRHHLEPACKERLYIPEAKSVEVFVI